MKSITAVEVKSLIDNNETITLLDVRTPMEFSRGKLKGAINLPVNEFLERIESVCPNKSGRIIVYCLSGSRSTLAVNEMDRLGYTNTYELTSGILAWRMNKFEMEVGV